MYQLDSRANYQMALDDERQQLAVAKINWQQHSVHDQASAAVHDALTRRWLRHDLNVRVISHDVNLLT